MDENFPISNIPLIFSQYRSKVLEESGKQWFHSDNSSNAQPAVSTISENQPSLSADASKVEVAQVSEVSVAAGESAVQLEEPAAPVKEAAPTYYYPDPWETEKLEAWAAKPVDPGVSIPPSEALDTPSQQPEAEESSSGKTQTKAHPNSNVNLFPFESPTNDEVQDSKYDLTEFDNGEIEVPPVAVRASHPSKFEKLTRADIPQTTSESAPSSQTNNEPKSNRNSRPKPSSAEIAKYRLRNCL